MKTTRFLSLLLLSAFIISFASPFLVQAQGQEVTHQEYREVVDLFFSVE
ncbi:hypothetical protein [Desulfuribacillus alkaliarsenatis]|nr:hypothetical protein [Desulfuribacillus alkaliarsenatis]